MSIVAWDGTTMAADQQWEVNGVRELGAKIHVRSTKCLAFVGDVAGGALARVDWNELAEGWWNDLN